MSKNTTFVYHVLVCLAYLFISSAASTPSTLPRLDFQGVGTSSLRNKSAQEDIPAGRSSQAEGVPKEPRNKKRMLHDLNLLPEENELLKDSSNSVTTSNAAGSPSILNPSKEFKPTVGPENSFQPAPNHHHFLTVWTAVDESSYPNTDLILGQSSGATTKRPFPLVPPTENLMAAQPRLSGHITNAPPETYLHGHSHMANKGKEIIVQKSDAERAKTHQNSEPTAFNEKKQKLSETHHIDRWEDINSKRVFISEGGARSTGKSTGAGHEIISDNDRSGLARGPQMRLEEATKSGGDGDSAIESELQLSRARTVFLSRLAALRSAGTEDKSIYLENILHGIFDINALKPAVRNEPYQGKDDSEQVISHSPYEQFKAQFRKEGPMDAKQALVAVKNILKAHVLKKAQLSLVLHQTQWTAPIERVQILNDVLLVLGIAEFKTVEGHESLVAFFSEVYQQERDRLASSSSAKIKGLKGSCFIDGGRDLTPHHTFEIRKADYGGSEKSPVKIMSLSTLRDDVIFHCVKNQRLRSSIDATMIFFYLNRYAQKMLLFLGVRPGASPQESQTKSINFVIEFWDKVLAVNSPMEKVYDEKLREAGISIDAERERMKKKRDRLAYTDMEWAYLLLKSWLSLEPAYKAFVEWILPDGQNKKNFCTFIRAQGLSEYILGVAGDRTHRRNSAV